MRKWMVCGFKNVDYVSKKTGKRVLGATLYLSSESQSKDIVGDEHIELFIRHDDGYLPSVGDTIQVAFNQFGRVESIIVC